MSQRGSHYPRQCLSHTIYRDGAANVLHSQVARQKLAAALLTRVPARLTRAGVELLMSAVVVAAVAGGGSAPWNAWRGVYVGLRRVSVKLGQCNAPSFI